MKVATVLLFISCLMLTFSCNKQSKELTTVNFRPYNPVTNEGFSGVKVSVIQEKNTSSGFNSSSKSEVAWEGVMDANGMTFY